MGDSDSDIYNTWKQSSHFIASHSPSKRIKDINYSGGRATPLRPQHTWSSLRALGHSGRLLYFVSSGKKGKRNEYSH